MEALGADRTRLARALPLAGPLMVAAAVLLTNLSITSSPDSSCGSILADRIDWSTNSYCGIAHRGTLAIVAGLLVFGVALTVATGLAAIGRTSLRPAVVVSAAAAVVAVASTILFAVYASLGDARTPTQGWGALRNVGVALSVGLVAVAGAYMYASRSVSGGSPAPEGA